MKINIIAGLCGGGKRTYSVKYLNAVHLNDIYSYTNKRLSKTDLSDDATLALDGVITKIGDILQHYDTTTVEVVYTDLYMYLQRFYYPKDGVIRQYTPTGLPVIIDDVIEKIRSDWNDILSSVHKMKPQSVSYVYSSETYGFTIGDLSHLQSILNKTTQQVLIEYINYILPGSTKPIYHRGITLSNNTSQEVEILEIIRDMGVSCKGKTIVDIGCGTGFRSFNFMREGAKWVYGVDSDTKVLSVCNMIKLFELSPHISFHCINIGSSSPNTSIGSVDVTVAIDIFKIVNDRDRAQLLRQMLSHSKEIVIKTSVHHKESIDTIATARRFVLTKMVNVGDDDIIMLYQRQY